MSKQKTLRRCLFAMLSLVVTLFAAAAILFHSQAFRDYALKKIVQESERSTGMRIDVQQMELFWRPLTLEFHGLVARNPNAAMKEPFFSAARVVVRVALLPLLHHRMEINRVEIDAPAVRVTTASDGKNNLPVLPNDGASSFETQIALLIVRDGLIDYDNRQITLSAELRNLRGQMALDRLTHAYKGQLAYDAGRIVTPDVRTFEHSAELHFVADSTRCVIERLDLSTLHSRFSAHGDLTDYKNPVFTGGYQGGFSGEDLRWIIKNSSVPVGEVLLKGTVAYRSGQGSNFFDRAYLDGNLESSSLVVPAGDSKFALKSVRSTYKLEKGYLHVDNLQAEALGGHVSSNSNVVNLRASGGQIHLTIRGASIQLAARQLAPSSIKTVEVAGWVSVDIAANWKENVRNADVQAHAVIRSPKEVTSIHVLPVDGVIDVDYDAARNRASFRPSTIRTKTAVLNIDGVLSRDSALNVRLSTSDLSELGELISSVTPPKEANSLVSFDLHGAADFTGKFTGALTDPRVEGQINAADLRVEGTTWRSLHVRLAADARLLRLDDGSLSGPQKEQITFNGSASLVNWSFDPAVPVALHTRLQNVPAAQVQQLVKISYPVSGLLSGELYFSGSKLSPLGHGHVELLQALVWNEPLNAFTLDFNADQHTAQLNAQLRAPAGTLSLKGTYDRESRHFEAHANTQNLKLEQIRVLQTEQEPIAGQLTAELSGGGSFDDPQVTARAQIPSLKVRNETVKDVNAQVTLLHKHVNFSLHSGVEDTSLEAKGGVDLTGAYPAKLELNTGGISIGPLLERFMPSRAHGVAGQMQVHISADGPLKDPARIEGQADISNLSVQINSIALSSTGDINLNYHAGVLQIAHAELKGSGTDIRVNGSFPIQSPMDMNVGANGTLDLKLLQDWTGGGHSSGQVDVQLSATGKKSQPVVQGRVRISDAIYTSDELPVGIESLNGEIAIDGNHLRISKLSWTAGGGTLSIGGSAVYGQNSSFNLALDAHSVRVRQNGVRAVVDANLSLTGATNASTLGGRVTVHKLSFNPSADLAQIAAQFSDDNTVSNSSDFARNTKLSVALQSDEDLNLASSQLSIAGSANLNAIGTLADPVILGRVSLTSGEVFFLGKRFEIQSGTIAFANTIRTEPVVSLYVKTVVDQYNITVNLTGPLDRLKSSYTSDPALSTADIINLLAFGQTTADAASNAATPASVAAESAVASAASGQLASQVQKIAGISQLTINPLAGNNENPGSQIAIQQRVSANILLTFSTDVTSSQNQSVQVQYQIKRNVSISVLRDEYGGYGIDVRYHKTF